MIKKPANFISLQLFLSQKESEALAHLAIDGHTTKAEIAASIIAKYLNEHKRRVT